MSSVNQPVDLFQPASFGKSWCQEPNSRQHTFTTSVDMRQLNLKTVINYQKLTQNFC